MSRALLALVAALAALALAACGDEEGGEPGSTATGPAAADDVIYGAEPAGDGDREGARPAARNSGAPEGGSGEDGAQGETGGGGGSRPASVEEAVRAVLTRAGTPAEGCAELVTERFVSEAYGDRAGCLAARRGGGLARSASVEVTAERGGEAEAVAVPDGGPYDGVEVAVTLVGDPAAGWLVDSLVADVPAGP